MGLFQFIYDDATRRNRAVAYPGFVDITVVNATPSAVNFTCTGQTLTASHAIDVWVDGRLQTETTHYTRDTGNNRIVTGSGINVGTEVKIRVFLK